VLKVGLKLPLRALLSACRYPLGLEAKTQG
jgi:hypothetical protein